MGDVGATIEFGACRCDPGRQRNPHLLDYKLVTASDAPRIDVAWVETPAQNGGPKGSKGVGEGNCMSTPVCLANAVADALGVVEIDLPLSPSKLAALVRE